MEYDYYQILGISPAADLDAIKKAFRRKVMECHPDRGGSHAEMVLVNEAWEVLSNPEVRSRYDEARTYAGDRSMQEAAEADASQARQRAEQYPRRWEEVEAWLNGLAGDFTGAQYGSVPVFGGIHFPTAGNSVSGCLFILIGAILGGVFISTALADFCERNNIKGTYRLALIVAPVLGGAWAGAGIHQWIGGEIKEAKERAARQAQREREREARLAQAAPPPEPPRESRVLGCERCGQKLRVPAMQAELLVTCKSCGHKFACPPG